MLYRTTFSFFVVSFLFGSLCAAREVLTLRNGFTIEVLSHTVRDGVAIADTGAGTVEFAAAEIANIEKIEERASGAAAAALLPAAASLGSIALAPEALLQEAALAQGLTPELVRSVAKIESGLRPDAVSPKGAVGFMQLMPGTAAALHVTREDPAENAKGGATYLRQLLLQYQGDAALALAAYNAGPGAVARYGGVPPYAETRRYVVRVLTELAKEQRKNK